MSKSKRLARRPTQGRMHGRLEQADGRNEGEYRNCEVYAKPRNERSRGFAQREKPLGDEQQRANRNSDNRRRKIFHLRMIYTSAPPQEEPDPAVQPKQWLSVAMEPPSSRSGSTSQRKSGAPFFHCIPSCWLKSQS